MYNAQNIRLGYITFENSNSIVIGSKIKIEIVNDFDNPDKKDGDAILKISKYSLSEKQFMTQEHILTEKDYNEIVTNILKIKSIDLLQDFKNVIDGYDTKLKFMSSNGTVEYNIYGLNYSDENTGYKDFLMTTQCILKIAKIKIPGIN
ncbi:hypothetical protein [Chryseobacterium oryctis]|uniref:Uncharacterized protein n=1 Tax=Chryseobacterium oryctis TaxID=2952618 RepID=A0ABT3HSP2_9FLAO|nr:hypothetical protein [Chryseobacterium oryctis]MCW3162801.1 hypothetical protein [Chryseobacterium oryctis]